MLSILINAYACSPNMGSEPGMAWNWCVNLAKNCELYIITEGEFRDQIEAVVPTLPQGRNMHFYYNPISDKIRRMCWNQGDWRFYKHYCDWQWKTYLMAKEICSQIHIDIIHQLNMIGFREPGYLWKIGQKPFIWGPIGGLKQFPEAYLQEAGWKMTLFIKLKNRINIYQLKHNRRVNEALKKACLLISSIPDSYRIIKKYKCLESIVIPETGCYYLSDDLAFERFDREEMHILWIGKFDFRKQLPMALKAVAAAKNEHIVLDVYGTGTDIQISSAKTLAKILEIETQVVWHGSKTNIEILEAMRNAQLFFFTSVSEDTSTVVLEAISNCLPVVCFDACGMTAVIDDEVGRKVSLSTPKQSVEDFARILNEMERHRDSLKLMSVNCKKRQEELSWENKAKRVENIYNNIARNQENKFD